LAQRGGGYITAGVGVVKITFHRSPGRMFIERNIHLWTKGSDRSIGSCLQQKNTPKMRELLSRPGQNPPKNMKTKNEEPGRYSQHGTGGLQYIQRGGWEVCHESGEENQGNRRLEESRNLRGPPNMREKSGDLSSHGLKKVHD